MIPSRKNETLTYRQPFEYSACSKLHSFTVKGTGHSRSLMMEGGSLTLSLEI